MTYSEKVRIHSHHRFPNTLTKAKPLQYVGFWLSYTLPTLVFLTAPLVLFAGRNRYVRSPPQGSVLPSSIRSWRLAARGRWSLNPVTTWRRMREDGFWDSAKPSVYLGGKGGVGESGRPMWMTWDDQWVDEVRRGFKACEVFLWYPIYCAFFSLFSFLVEKELAECSDSRAYTTQGSPTTKSTTT